MEPIITRRIRIVVHVKDWHIILILQVLSIDLHSNVSVLNNINVKVNRNDMHVL